MFVDFTFVNYDLLHPVIALGALKAMVFASLSDLLIDSALTRVDKRDALIAIRSLVMMTWSLLAENPRSLFHFLIAAHGVSDLVVFRTCVVLVSI